VRDSGLCLNSGLITADMQTRVGSNNGGNRYQNAKINETAEAGRLATAATVPLPSCAHSFVFKFLGTWGSGLFFERKPAVLTQAYLHATRNHPC